jgi:hypothetical protein
MPVKGVCPAAPTGFCQIAIPLAIIEPELVALEGALTSCF